MDDDRVLTLDGTNGVTLGLRALGTCRCGYGCLLSHVTLTMPTGSLSTTVTEAAEIDGILDQLAQTGAGSWESPGHTGFGHRHGPRGLQLSGSLSWNGAVHVRVSLSTEKVAPEEQAPWFVTSTLVLYQGAHLDSLARQAALWRKKTGADAAFEQRANPGSPN